MSVWLVTGAAGGIGAKLVTRLLARGDSVVAGDLERAALEAAAHAHGWDGSRVETCVLDVRESDSWQRFVQCARVRFGAIDGLMNVAGVLHPGWCHEVDAAQVARQLDVNVRGTILGVRAVAPGLIGQRRGHIVNIGSLASLAAVPGLSVYSASKFAVRGFSLAASEELREYGIAVTVVEPDAVETPMLALQEAYTEAALTFSGARALTADDVARAVVDEVLVKRPLEYAMPRTRAVLARIANAVPGLARWVAPVMRAKGERARRKRAGRG